MEISKDIVGNIGKSTSSIYVEIKKEKMMGRPKTWETVKTLKWEPAFPREICPAVQMTGRHDVAQRSDRLRAYPWYCRKCSACGYEVNTIRKIEERS